MKKNSITIFALIIIGIGASFFANNASAWNAPNSPSNTVGTGSNYSRYLHKSAELINTECLGIYPRPEWIDTTTTPPTLGPIINYCGNVQGKNGGFITEKFLKSGNQYSWSMPGFVIAESYLSNLRWNTLSGFFKAFAQGTQGQLVILGNGADTYHQNESETSSAPILAGYLSSNTKQLDLVADPQFCNTQTMITTDTRAFQIWSKGSNKNAAINARGVQLSGGNPRPGMILVSTDDQGNAVWATPQLSTDGTSVTFAYGTTVSPVSTGQSICP